MKRLPIYQIDAFSSDCFGGNPAAIIPLDAWLPQACLQRIADENNLSETAFLVPDTQTDFQLRWFAPKAEVDLCGHATLASAWWLFNEQDWPRDELRFTSRSGVLTARRCAQGVEIQLPSRASQRLPKVPPRLSQALGRPPEAVLSGANLIAVYPNQQDIECLQPDFHALKAFHPQGILVTAPGHSCDFVSRYFVPSFGIDEDPVTGSAHADLAPYWAQRLGQHQFSARQLSARGGKLEVQIIDQQVLLRGTCALYLRGEIQFEDPSTSP